LATFLRPFNKQLFAMNKLAGLCDPHASFAPLMLINLKEVITFKIQMQTRSAVANGEAAKN